MRQERDVEHQMTAPDIIDLYMAGIDLENMIIAVSEPGDKDYQPTFIVSAELISETMDDQGRRCIVIRDHQFNQFHMIPLYLGNVEIGTNNADAEYNVQEFWRYQIPVAEHLLH